MSLVEDRWTGRLAPVERRRGVWRGGVGREHERCPQCHFPWFLHPEDYDLVTDEMVHTCSEYPVDPVRAVTAWITP